jgi:hypothetical protein
MALVVVIGDGGATPRVFYFDLISISITRRPFLFSSETAVYVSGDGPCLILIIIIVVVVAVYLQT